MKALKFALRGWMVPFCSVPFRVFLGLRCESWGLSIAVAHVGASHCNRSFDRENCALAEVSDRGTTWQKNRNTKRRPRRARLAARSPLQSPNKHARTQPNLLTWRKHQGYHIGLHCVQCLFRGRFQRGWSVTCKTLQSYRVRRPFVMLWLDLAGQKMLRGECGCIVNVSSLC